MTCKMNIQLVAYTFIVFDICFSRGKFLRYLSKIWTPRSWNVTVQITKIMTISTLRIIMMYFVNKTIVHNNLLLTCDELENIH